MASAVYRCQFQAIHPALACDEPLVLPCGQHDAVGKLLQGNLDLRNALIDASQLCRHSTVGISTTDAATPIDRMRKNAVGLLPQPLCGIKP